MKRVWMALVGVAAAFAGFSTAARAEDPPTVVELTRVTYYLEVGDLEAAKRDELTALLKREFPKAQVDALEGTIRIQTDADSLNALDKLLHEKHLVGPGITTKQRIEVRSDALPPKGEGAARVTLP